MNSQNIEDNPVPPDDFTGKIIIARKEELPQSLSVLENTKPFNPIGFSSKDSGIIIPLKEINKKQYFNRFLYLKRKFIKSIYREYNSN